MLAYLLLAAAQAVGLLLIPLTFFGVWLQLAALALFGWQTEFRPVGVIPLVVLTGVVMAAELIRLALAPPRIPKAVRRRAGMAALAGALIGAAAGIPLPLAGSMFGALLGAVAGSLIAVLTSRPAREQRRAMVGQAIGLALTASTGVSIAVFTLLIVAR